MTVNFSSGLLPCPCASYTPPLCVRTIGKKRLNQQFFYLVIIIIIIIINNNNNIYREDEKHMILYRFSLSV